MHDNHNSPIENGTVPTTAKQLHVDFNSKKVTLQQRFLNHSGPIYTTAQGNYQLLKDGNVFVGHGWIPVLEEYDSKGDILTTIQFGTAEPRPGGGYLSNLAPTLSYKGFKQHWVGCPATKPDVFAESSNGKTEVYVSWNGATGVKAWNVYGGSKNKLKHISTTSKSGFETKIELKEVVGYVQVKPVLEAGYSCTVKTSAVTAVQK